MKMDSNLPIVDPFQKNGCKWRLLAVLFLVVTLNYGDRTALTVVFPLLRTDLGMSDVELGAIGSLFLWSYALVSPFAGYIGDRVSRASMVIWSLTAWSVVTGLTGLVSSGHQLLSMRLLLGFSESLYLPAALGLIAQYHSSKTRATAMGIHMIGLHLGIVGGGTLAAYLGDRYGWRPAIFVLSGTGLLLALVCSRVLFRIPLQRAAAGLKVHSQAPPLRLGQALLQLLGVPSFWVLTGEAMLTSIGIWIFINWLPLYFKETFNLTLTGAGFSGTFAITSGSVAGILAGGYLSDILAKRGVRHRMILQAMFYFVAAPFLLGFLWSPSFTTVSVCIFLFSLLRGLGQANANPLLCDLLSPKIWSSAVGLMNMINCLAGGAGILIAGYLKQYFGLGAVFAGVAALVLLAAILLFVGYRVFLKKDLQHRAAVMSS